MKAKAHALETTIDRVDDRQLISVIGAAFKYKGLLLKGRLGGFVNLLSHPEGRLRVAIASWPYDFTKRSTFHEARALRKLTQRNSIDLRKAACHVSRHVQGLPGSVRGDFGQVLRRVKWF